MPIQVYRLTSNNHFLHMSTYINECKNNMATADDPYNNGNNKQLVYLICFFFIVTKFVVLFVGCCFVFLRLEEVILFEKINHP